MTEKAPTYDERIKDIENVVDDLLHDVRVLTDHINGLNSRLLKAEGKPL